MRGKQLGLIELALTILMMCFLLLGCSYHTDDKQISDSQELYLQSMKKYSMDIKEIIFDGAVIYELGNTSSEWRGELDKWLEQMTTIQSEVSAVPVPEPFALAQKSIIQAIDELNELPPYLEEVLINVNADRSPIFVHLYAALEAVEQYQFHIEL